MFASAVVEIDWERRVVKFHDPARYTDSGNGTVLPLTFDEGGRPYTMATVVTTGDTSVPVRLVVDTGASSALSLDVGSHPNIRLPEGAVQTVLGRGGNGEITGHLGRVQSLQLGGYVVRNIVTDFPDESQGTAGIGGRQGRLGAGVLRRFKGIYDYSRARMTLEPNRFLNEPFETPQILRQSAAVGQAVSQQQEQSVSQAEREVRRLEREWLDAYERRDVEAMNRIVADDFTITHANGTVQTKAEIMVDLRASRESARPSSTFSTEDVRARVYGDAVVLTGRLTQRMERDGQMRMMQARYTDTYVRRQGRWQVVASQLTRIQQ